MYDSARLLVEQRDLETIVDLRRVAAPTLIVNGEVDPLVDATQTQATAARFPAAVYKVEKGAGHFLHFERPSILETYVRFLTGTDARRAAAPLPIAIARGVEELEPLASEADGLRALTVVS
jgi:pimeloyl-ACP methyl ester carboxylesterase